MINGTKSQVFPKHCFEGSPKVTGESIKTETGSRAVAQKKWLVKRTGLLVLGVLCNLKEKVIEDCGTEELSGNALWTAASSKL